MAGVPVFSPFFSARSRAAAAWFAPVHGARRSVRNDNFLRGNLAHLAPVNAMTGNSPGQSLQKPPGATDHRRRPRVLDANLEHMAQHLTIFPAYRLARQIARPDHDSGTRLKRALSRVSTRR